MNLADISTLENAKTIPARQYMTPANKTINQGINKSEEEKKSGRLDSNQRPLAPHASTLPGCATSRDAAKLRLILALFIKYWQILRILHRGSHIGRKAINQQAQITHYYN